MKKIKFLIRNHFGFSQRETNGFIVLLGIMAGLLFLPLAVGYFYNPEREDYNRENRMLLDSLLLAMSYHPEKLRSGELPLHRPANLPDTIDPNSASLTEMEKVFGRKIAQTVLKYREKGGRFRVKQDLRKIYGMNDEAFQSARQFIDLPDSMKSPVSIPYALPEKVQDKVQPLEFDINLADTADLEKLKGIGKALARRIIKFRDKLGGFVSEEQFGEVYGLTPEVITELTGHTYIPEGFLPRKINLNTATLRELETHPYIGKKYGLLIFRYREQHGPFKTMEQLYEMKGLEEEKVRKIIPYVTIR